MVNKTRIAALMLLPVILLPAAGCARNKVKGDTAYVARDVNTLYSLAKERLDRQQPCLREPGSVPDRAERVGHDEPLVVDQIVADFKPLDARVELVSLIPELRDQRV